MLETELGEEVGSALVQVAHIGKTAVDLLHVLGAGDIGGDDLDKVVLQIPQVSPIWLPEVAFWEVGNGIEGRGVVAIFYLQSCVEQRQGLLAQKL